MFLKCLRWFQLYAKKRCLSLTTYIIPKPHLKTRMNWKIQQMPIPVNIKITLGSTLSWNTHAQALITNTHHTLNSGASNWFWKKSLLFNINTKIGSPHQGKPNMAFINLLDSIWNQLDTLACDTADCWFNSYNIWFLIKQLEQYEKVSLEMCSSLAHGTCKKICSWKGPVQRFYQITLWTECCSGIKTEKITLVS